MKCSLGIFNVLEEITSLSHSTVFLCFFALITEEGFLSLLFFGTLHSNGYIFPFLLCFSLLFFSQLFVRPSQTAILLFCIYFSWRWSWSLSYVQCHEPPSIFHQALRLSDLVPSFYFAFPLYNRKGFDLVHIIISKIEYSFKFVRFLTSFFVKNYFIFYLKYFLG